MWYIQMTATTRVCLSTFPNAYELERQNQKQLIKSIMHKMDSEKMTSSTTVTVIGLQPH